MVSIGYFNSGVCGFSPNQNRQKRPRKIVSLNRALHAVIEVDLIALPGIRMKGGKCDVFYAGSVAPPN